MKTAALLLLLAAWPAFAQPAAKLKLRVFDFEPDLRTSLVHHPAPGVELLLTQRDPTATGRIAILDKKPIDRSFTVSAIFSIRSANDCAGGLWLSTKSQNSIFYAVEQKQKRMRVLMFSGFFGDLVKPFAMASDGGVVGQRVVEDQGGRSYFTSADRGETWEQVFRETFDGPQPGSLRTRRYGLAIENRPGSPDAPDCTLVLYKLKE